MSSGAGGSVYWGKKLGDNKGIAVLFSWGGSIRHQSQLNTFIHLYHSLHWNCLVSHSHFISAFNPERALSQSFVLLHELIEALRVKPCAVVFVALSGGSKACMYKIFQILQENCGGLFSQREVRLVRNCLSGHIYDSSPLDFTSDFSTQFSLPPAFKRVPGSSKLASWVAKGIASGLDGLCLTRFEFQRAEYWQALYSSVDLGAPNLILCSENDDLAPYKTINKFSKCLQLLGGDVNLVKWNHSPHIGHYEYHPIQYRFALTNLLEKATSVYSRRIQRLGERINMDDCQDDISELICDLQNAAVTSNESLGRVAVGPGDHFFVSSSSSYDDKVSEPSKDEWKRKSVYLSSPPSINAHSVLGQMLFDVCVPKNVEGWDIRFSGTLNGQPFASARRHSPFDGIKSIRRSKL